MIVDVTYFKIIKSVALVSFFITLTLTGLNAFSLEQAVYQSIHTNPEVKAKINNFKSINREKDIVRAAYFPTLNLSTGVGKAKDLIVPAYRISGAVVTRKDSSLIAKLNLFQGFHTYHDVASQSSRENAASSYVKETKSSIALKTIESYIAMMKQKAIVEISKENVFSHKEIYEKLKEKEKSGIGKASDLGFASGRLTLAKVNTVVNENNFIQSKVLFETILGGSVDIKSLKEPIFDYTLPKTLEDAALMALDYNPSILVGKYNSLSAKSNYQRSRSVFYPSLDFEVKGSLFEEQGPFDYSVDSSYAMFYLNFNLYNGSADKATMQKERFTLHQNQQVLNATKREVTKKLGTAWIASVQIKKQLTLLSKMRVFSKKTMEDYYAEFGIGRRTLLDLINVKNDYNNARQSYEVAKYDLLLSKFRILDAMGGLVNYFLAKADTMNLELDNTKTEHKSVYEIIREMDKKLKNNETFVPYNQSDHTSLDKALKNKQSKKVDDIEGF